MQKKSISKISIIAASALTLGTCLPAGIAFADPDPVDPPSVGGQSGAGSTAMTMVWEDSDQEYGGTEDPNNPPSDPNDPTSPGENLAFKAPTAINFVAKANGELIAPSYSAVYLENFSSFGIHVSSMQIEQGTGWNIVENQAASANTANAVWGKIGPYNEKLNWYDHKIKADVTTSSKWGMAASGAANNQSKLFLATEGKFANLNLDLSEAKTFGTIHWYLKMGGEGQPAVDPSTIHALNKPTTASANGSFKLKSSLSAAAAEDLDEAIQGNTVYIVAEPESGYVVTEMSVTKVSDNSDVAVAPDSQNANVGSFTMPNEAVDVDVTFESPYGTVVQSWDAGATPGTVTGTLYDSGTFVVSGQGAMTDYQFNAEWNKSWEDEPRLSITSVIIEDGVTSVGNNAFYRCSNVQSIVMSDSVTRIGDYAFGMCSALTSVTMSDNVTSIGTQAFVSSIALQNLDLPESLVSIGDSAFAYSWYLWNLEDLTLPAGVTSIGNDAFNAVRLQSITLPAGVTSIGSTAFSQCSCLTTINAGFSENAVAGAPWGAPNNPTINYNYTG